MKSVMAFCWSCDQRFDTEGWKSMCDECKDQGVLVLNDEKMKLLSYRLHDIHNYQWTEEELEALAHSKVGPNIARAVIVRMKDDPRLELMQDIKEELGIE